ncbi:MAG: glycosyltransferase family 4 protein [bacterium]|nr:glycosyltransferase family 4 protein [bacterium]
MRKKLALILNSTDECFTQDGFSGGANKVTKNLIFQLIESEKFDIDIYCKKGQKRANTVCGINSITVLGELNFEKKLKKKLSEIKYNYILSSDILLSFANNLVHSNSFKFKSKNGKNRLMQALLKLYNYSKVKYQEHHISKTHSTFTVSNSLKNDYVENFDLSEDKVFVCHPAIDDLADFVQEPRKNFFTLGSIVGGGLNKGGYLLLWAMSKLPTSSKIQARFIYPKIKKAGFFKLVVKMLGLSNKVQVLPKQSDMNVYYKMIDCYVLPSLNEAFGLVVTEAASNYKPSIVSSTTGVRELIEDGVNGFVFDREINKIENLTDKISEVYNMYMYENEKFTEVSKNAHKIAENLDWKEFANVIIDNMVEEKV